MLIRLANKKTALFGVGIMLALGAFFVFGGHASAQQSVQLAQQNLNVVQQQVGFGTRSLLDIVVDIVRIFIGFLGLIAIIIVIYGGFLYLTSGGDAGKIEKAKKLLINAGIGLVIIFAAYGIVSFIFRALGVGFGNHYQVQGDVSTPGGFGGALGNGIIQSHYPLRNAVDVARNTSIMVTFKEAMDQSTIITNGLINADHTVATGVHVLILTRADFDNKDLSKPLTAVTAATNDGKTFVFKPQQLLGNPTSPEGYVVVLGNALKKADGTAAFGSVGDYTWGFEVSTKLDVTPPTIVSVIPKLTNPPADNGDEDQFNDKTARNAIIQINFSEAVNPLTVSGDTSSFNLLKVLNLNSASADKTIAGKFEISNQYKTVEFTTNEPCGINSCGEQIYCLPGLSTIQLLAKSATIAATADLPFASVPNSGVADVADNALDGNANSKADGNNGVYDLNIVHQLSQVPPPPQGAADANCLATQFNTVTDPNGDNYQYAFCTTDGIDLVPPQVLSYSPTAGAVEVDPSTPLLATFDKNLSATTIRQDSGYGDGYCPCATANDCVNDSTHSQSCSAGKCVDAKISGTPKITCYRFDEIQQCKSRVLSGQTTTSTDLQLCVERDHITLETPLTTPVTPPVGYWMNLDNTTVIEGGKAQPRGQVDMDHVPFIQQINYGIKYGSGIKDLFQNCYIPSAAPGCQRVETSTPGQYNYVPNQWPGGASTFPSCDLTKTTLSTHGLFNLSYQDAADVNKVLPLQAYQWDQAPSALYAYDAATKSSRLDLNDYFKDIPKKDMVNFFLYHYQSKTQNDPATGYYLYVLAGKEDASITAPTDQSLSFDLTSTNNSLISASNVISVEPESALPTVSNNTLKVSLKWSSNQTDGFIYKIGNIENFNFAVKVSDSTAGVKTRYVFPGGTADLRTDRPFAILTVDRVAPVATAAHLSASAKLDAEKKNYLVTIVWDDSASGDNNRDIAEAFSDIIFPNNSGANQSSVALNDQGSSGDAIANDNKWSATVSIPASAVGDGDFTGVLFQTDPSKDDRAKAILNTSTKDAAGNSLAASVSVPISLQ